MFVGISMTLFKLKLGVPRDRRYGAAKPKKVEWESYLPNENYKPTLYQD